MKKLVIALCVWSIVLAPVALYADEAPVTQTTTSTRSVTTTPSTHSVTAQSVTSSGRPVQFLTEGGYVDNTHFVKEPRTVDWVTGRGRKDGVLEWAVDDNYLKKTAGMFGRGFSNVSFGWADVITHPFRWSKNAPLGLGTVMGLVMGPFVAVLRTTSGALDIATCWVPWWHGVPMKKQVLGLHDVAHYGTIEDVDQYDHETKRYGFNYLSEDY